jgi:hypothetical protein
LEIAVGGMGVSEGGGGIFVVGPADTPLVIAAGGGGGLDVAGGAGVSGGGGLPVRMARKWWDQWQRWCGRQRDPWWRRWRGRVFERGQNSSIFSTGGAAFPDLAGGSTGGGFGGGGGADFAGLGAGGGGGGYSGGGGGGSGEAGAAPGSGGSSLDAGIDQILMADFNAGNGEIVITPIPEPAIIALLATGLLSLAAVRRRRR